MDNLGFGFVETDAIYRSLGRLDRDPIWDAGEVAPFGTVQLSPAAAFFSYGGGIFEGLKVHRAQDGRALAFRHRENARRFQRSAARLMMPPFPEEQFLRAVRDVAQQNLRFLPPSRKGSFYLRPLQHAIEPQVGIKPSREFWVLIFGIPVGSYFSSESVRLKVVEQGRVAPGGTGAVKAIGNYAGGIWLAEQWRPQGFDDVLYLDAREVRYVTETSGANVFVRLRSGPLVTPPLDDQILAGVTRDSVIRIAREICGQEVVERPLSLEEVLQDGAEVFCTGTAWTVRHVDELDHRGRVHKFDSSELQRAILEVLLGIQYGERDDPFGWTTEIEAR